MEISYNGTMNTDAIKPLLEGLEGRSLIGIKIAAKECDFVEDLRTWIVFDLTEGFDEFLAIQSKVICARHKVRISLNTSNNLAHNDPERENVDFVVILIAP